MEILTPYPRVRDSAAQWEPEMQVKRWGDGLKHTPD